MSIIYKRVNRSDTFLALTDSAWDALDWYHSYGPSTIKAYSDDMGIVYATARKRVDALIRAGLLTRTRSRGEVGLTGHGWKVWPLEHKRRQMARMLVQQADAVRAAVESA